MKQVDDTRDAGGSRSGKGTKETKRGFIPVAFIVIGLAVIALVVNALA